MQTLAVAEHLNFHHAAKALGISQSDVSTRIKVLEQDLGIILFERHPRGVRMTEAGQHFVEEIAIGIGHLNHAVTTAGMLAGGTCGNLRIGLHSSLAGGFLAELLMSYRQQRPEVEIEITEGQTWEMGRRIREGRLDIAFVAGKLIAEDCHSRQLWTEAPLAVLPASHDLANCESIGWADLIGETFLVRYDGAGPQVHDHIVRRVAEHGRRPRIRRLNVGRDTLLHMVAQDYGVTIATEASAMNPVPGVEFRTIADEPEPVPFNAIWSPHNRSRPLHDLLDLAKHMGQSCAA